MTTNTMQTKTAKLPEHFMVSECDGGLYDTRKAGWEKAPVRAQYRYAHRRITNATELKATLRVPYAWPGGYDVLLLTSDGAVLCNACARKNLRHILDSVKNHSSDGWRVDASFRSEDADSATCDQCGKEFGAGVE